MDRYSLGSTHAGADPVQITGGAAILPTRLALGPHDDVVPPGGEGPLDPRLDMRYRADALQLVTFMSGDSDGLHWGLWYDSPAYAPVIAHNYAHDSAETWIDADTALAWLQTVRLEKQRQAAEELARNDDDEQLRPYALGGWRALRVVELHLRAWIAQARQGLAEGSTAYALALGLYLHWLDCDDLRAEAGQLLLDAYAAEGYQPFVDILRVHLLHRDLGSVGVFVR